MRPAPGRRLRDDALADRQRLQRDVTLGREREGSPGLFPGDGIGLIEEELVTDVAQEKARDAAEVRDAEAAARPKARPCFNKALSGLRLVA